MAGSSSRGPGCGARSRSGGARAPLKTDAGEPFPVATSLLFLTFSVILVTLVGMGLTLPFVIRRLDSKTTAARSWRTRRPASAVRRPR